MRDPKKFDPARAHVLDAPEREIYLPTDRLVGLLELSGTETVLDYGAGTGRVGLAVAAAFPAARVIAIDESEEMLALLRGNVAGAANVEALLVAGNQVPLPDAGVDHVLAVNMLHEIRGEGALREIHRLLGPGGFMLAVDWERGRRREVGPPDELLYSAQAAREELLAAGFEARLLDAGLPFHFALRATPTESK